MSAKRPMMRAWATRRWDSHDRQATLRDRGRVAVLVGDVLEGGHQVIVVGRKRPNTSTQAP